MRIFCIRISKLLLLTAAWFFLCSEQIVAQHCGCVLPDTIVIHASFINPTNTGYNYDSTFVCKSAYDSIIAFNKGTIILTVQEVDIINETSPVPQFFLDNRMQTLPVNIVLGPNSHKSFPIHFQPTREGWDTAIIRVTWDSAGVKKMFSQNLLIGYGRLDHASLVPSLTNYTIQNNDTLAVPLILTNILSTQDAAMGMSFTISYPENLLLFGGSDYNLLLSDYMAPHSTTTMGQTMTTFTLKSLSPITTLNPVVMLHFIPIANADTACSITISDFVLWGQNPQDSLCYVATGTGNAHVHITDTLSNNLNLSTHIKVVNNGNQGISIESSNLNIGAATIRVFSLLGVEVASWEGTINGSFQKALAVPDLGAYYIVVQVGGQQYIYKRMM